MKYFYLFLRERDGERERERMVGRCTGRHGERESRGRGEAGRRIREWGWSELEKDRVRRERG